MNSKFSVDRFEPNLYTACKVIIKSKASKRSWPLKFQRGQKNNNYSENYELEDS